MAARKSTTAEATTQAADAADTTDPTEVETPEASTTLDTDVTKPSVTAPGDGPADTVDPTEVAHSVTPAPGAEAIAVGTVNAVVPGPKVRAKAKTTAEHRFEEFDAMKPDGSTVRVRRNIDTGASEVVE